MPKTSSNRKLSDATNEIRRKRGEVLFRVKFDLLIKRNTMCEQLKFWRQTCRNRWARASWNIKFPAKIQGAVLHGHAIRGSGKLKTSYIRFSVFSLLAPRELSSILCATKLRIGLQTKGKLYNSECLRVFSMKIKNARQNIYWPFKRHVSSWLFVIVMIKIRIII